MDEDPLKQVQITDPARSRRQYWNSVWHLTFGPFVWALHFLASYLTAAIYCAKTTAAESSAYPVTQAILVYTLLGLSLTAIIGWRGFRSHRLADSELPHDFNNVADRHRFLGFATFLLALLSGIAILFTGLVVAFIGNCQ